MIITGKHTYVGSIKELFDPVIEVGAFSQIANGATFIGGGQHPSVLNRNLVANYPFAEKWEIEGYPKTDSKGKIIIGNDVWIGENVTILGGVVIGDGAIIGAGSIVAKDIPPYCIAVGNPIKTARMRFLWKQIEKLCRMQWWNLPDERIKEMLPDMLDVNKFILKYEDTLAGT